MNTEQMRVIRRHSAYFRGWAQAFGNHETTSDDKRELRWLLGEEQLGLILTPLIRDGLGALAAEMDGLTDKNAETQSDGPADRPGALMLGADALRIGTLTLPLQCAPPAVLDLAAALLAGAGDLHLYQTYHLIYASGTRILTLSRRAPLALIYREIDPLRIDLQQLQDQGLRPAADAC